jgi:hypothetical protein
MCFFLLKTLFRRTILNFTFIINVFNRLITHLIDYAYSLSENGLL